MTDTPQSNRTPDREALRTPPKAPITNDTIAVQLGHRSIRKFKTEPLTPDQLETLYQVARHGASCTFAQQCTIVHITDPAIRHEIFLASGQPYVDGEAGDLFIFVIDVHRNTRIREEAGIEEGPSGRTNILFAAIYDTVIAAQNMVIAAESMGLGTLYLASIQADPERVIKALRLPAHTYPAFGLIVGHADQEPQFKPRLPLSILTAENTYPEIPSYEEGLADYDATLETYYDLRDINNRVDSFTKQIRTKFGMGAAERSPMQTILHDQGLGLE